ncbi:Thymidylate kinase, partial [Frankliniella fusca]
FRWDHDRPRVRNGGKNPNPSGGRLERFRELGRVPARPAAASARSPIGRPLGRSDRHLRRHSASSPLSSPNPTFRRHGGDRWPHLASLAGQRRATTGRFGDSAARAERRAGASRSSLPAPVLHDCRRPGNGQRVSTGKR